MQSTIDYMFKVNPELVNSLAVLGTPEQVIFKDSHYYKYNLDE